MKEANAIYFDYGYSFNIIRLSIYKDLWIIGWKLQNNDSNIWQKMGRGEAAFNSKSRRLKPKKIYLKLSTNAKSKYPIFFKFESVTLEIRCQWIGFKQNPWGESFFCRLEGIHTHQVTRIKNFELPIHLQGTVFVLHFYSV